MRKAQVRAPKGGVPEELRDWKIFQSWSPALPEAFLCRAPGAGLRVWGYQNVDPGHSVPSLSVSLMCPWWQEIGHRKWPGLSPSLLLCTPSPHRFCSPWPLSPPGVGQTVTPPGTPVTVSQFEGATFCVQSNAFLIISHKTEITNRKFKSQTYWGARFDAGRGRLCISRVTQWQA